MSESQFEINKIYTKDISVETPNAPEIYKVEWQPEIDLQLGNDLTTLEEEGLYEVSLTLTVTAKLGEKVAYIVEVEQAGIFTIEGFENEQQAYLMGAMIPNILFPYTRETISSLTQKAGFPPMLLNPIDFNAMFQQHLQEELEEKSEEKTESSVSKKAKKSKKKPTKH